MKRTAEICYIKLDTIIYSNSKIDWEKAYRIAKEMDPDKFGVIPAFYNGKGYVITDGNHRCTAAKIRGYKGVPAILLTKNEFEILKKDKEAFIDFGVYVPEKIKVYG